MHTITVENRIHIKQDEQIHEFLCGIETMFQNRKDFIGVKLIDKLIELCVSTTSFDIS